jgi:hypothetical protein
MIKHVALAALAAILFSTSSGCVAWRHCWGSWAYYGTCDQCGYVDNCPAGPCGKSCGGCCDNSCDTCGESCDDCCDSCGCCDSCCGCHDFSLPFHDILSLFHSPHPVGCTDCYGCQGCGEKYCCDWINSPPTRDPCDCCGNYVGCRDPRPCYQQSPRFGSVPLHSGHAVDAEGVVTETPSGEPVPAPRPSPGPQSKRPRSQSSGVQKAGYNGLPERGILWK